MKKIISILICMIISCIFCIYMGIVFSSVLSGDVFATSKKTSIESVKNIKIKNYDDKIRKIKSIEKNKLKYSKDLSNSNGKEVYLDKESSVYMYDNNELVSYSINIDPDSISSAKILKEDAINYAEKYLSKMVDKPDIYKLQSVEYDKYLNEYCIAYMHYINNVKSTDIVYLEIGVNGVLNGFSIQNQMKFDNININDEDINSAKKIVESKLKNKYSSKVNEIIFSNVVIGVNDDDVPVLLLTVEYQVMIDKEQLQESDTFEISIENI